MKCPCCELEDGLHLGSCQKAKDDLLSIAGQLAEAARKYHAAMQDTVCNGEQLRDLHTALGEELAAWDAAMKGRK